jgi:hypothetical protein
VRCADARSRERDRPEGVTQGFHVSVYKVDPNICVFTCNLLTKDDWRLTLADEILPGWPKMPLVIKPISFTCRAERLAGARHCPNSARVIPPSFSQRIAPSTNSGEEVTLGKSCKIVWCDILNTPLVYNSISDMTVFD